MTWIAQYSSLPAVAVFASILLVPAAAMAQETGADNEPDSDAAEEEHAHFEERIVVLGSRAHARSVTESQVPIDAIPVEDIMRQGATTLDYQLRNLIPSFNVATHPISDAATLVRPSSLRNLAHDHTLILVNGKRRHRSSVVAWFGGVTDGAQGPDISTIPAIALRGVEVLRDGGSAQYGSDAIAGVINFQLKDDAAGGAIELHSGSYIAGDGAGYTVAGNFGLPMGRGGFANLSFEYGGADPTDRSVQRLDAAALVAAGNTHVADPVQIWGNPMIEDDVKLFANIGHRYDNGLQFYGFANFAEKKVTEGFFFRNPNSRQSIYSLDGGQTLLIGDVLRAKGMGTANCPEVRITNDVPDQAALAQVFADPNCFSFQEIAPGGFTPQFGGIVTDSSVVAGLRKELNNGFAWDLSASFGSHESDFFFMNTVNASLGPDTPRDFDPGLYRQEDVNLNFDISYSVSHRVNVAAGVEWRDESFTVGAGGRPSWEVGPYAAQGFIPASNGFPGFPDYTAGTWSRENVAVYGDLELHGEDDRWSLGGALRLEDFDVFGKTTNGKLSFRRGLNEVVSVRGGVSTGFRAPTPGQQNALNVQTTIDPTTLELVDSATVPSTFVAAGPRGGKPLEPEESVHATAGLVIDTGPFTLTADYFNVDISDRLSLSQVLTLTEEERGAAALTGHHLGTEPVLLPLLHQRLLDPDRRHRRRLDLDSGRPRRRHRVQLHPELHRHRGHGGVGPAEPRGCARHRARRAPSPLELRGEPAGRTGQSPRPPQPLRPSGSTTTTRGCGWTPRRRSRTRPTSSTSRPASPSPRTPRSPSARRTCSMSFPRRPLGLVDVPRFPVTAR